MKPHLYWVTLLLVLAIASSCTNASESTISPTDIQESLTQAASNTPKAPTRTQAPPEAPTITSPPTTTSTPPNPAILPHPLYFLSGLQENAQVWRLETDGITLTQITHEESGVGDFAVSPLDGRLAVVSDNQLLLLDSRGANPQQIADARQVDPSIEDYVFHSSIGSSSFSPDGKYLAYGFDGLHLYHLDSGLDEHLLTNLGNLLGEPFVFTKEVYGPGAWSPDGSMLLIIMGYYEGSTLAVMDLGAEQPYRRLWSNGPVCCTFSWSADGRAVLVADPSYSVSLPGLWEYDPWTGEETVIVPGVAEDGSLRFSGWPVKPDENELIFFYANPHPFSPEAGIELEMVRSYADGSDMAPIRPEKFHIIQALWAQDGDLVLIVQRRVEDQWQIILVRPDGSPLQVLFEGQRIRKLVWGP